MGDAFILLHYKPNRARKAELKRIYSILRTFYFFLLLLILLNISTWASLFSASSFFLYVPRLRPLWSFTVHPLLVRTIISASWIYFYLDDKIIWIVWMSRTFFSFYTGKRKYFQTEIWRAQLERISAGIEKLKKK